MDDVARALSMSKKTLYQFFDNKDRLVTEVVQLHMDRERIEFAEIANKAKNAIEELYLLSKCMREHVFKINPALLYDLQKYHGTAWGIFQQFKSEFMQKQVVQNIERGMSEGYYRDSLNPQVLAILRLEVVQLIFNDQVFPRNQYDFVEVQLQVFDHFVHGLLSPKGKELYDQYHHNFDQKAL